MNPEKELEVLCAELRSREGVRRERARGSLVKMGKSAVPAVLTLLNDRNTHVRWEACKALGSIRDPTTSPALVQALTDSSIEVQWLAAEALIAIGERAIAPLLLRLEVDFNSVFLRQAAHHVLHAMERQKKLNEKLLNVLNALRYLEPRSTVAVAARAALASVRKARR